MQEDLVHAAQAVQRDAPDEHVLEVRVVHERAVQLEHVLRARNADQHHDVQHKQNVDPDMHVRRTGRGRRNCP